MAGSCILVRVQPSRPRRKRTTEPTDREKRINAALGSIAEERGITQMEIQRRLEGTEQPITQPSLSQAFTGRRSLTLSEFEAVCSAVGVSMREVLDRTGLP